MKRTLLKPNIHWLAIFIPVSFALAYIPAFKNQIALFACSCFAMIVVSVWIANATEQLAAKVGATWGGMLNAAFGNLPELIFGLIAILKGLGPLVKAAWTGAIIGNLLLVIGSAMVTGGFKYGILRFPVDRANDAVAGLLIASVAVLLPSIYFYTLSSSGITTTQNFTEDISIWIAVFLLMAYISSLIYTVVLDRTRAQVVQHGNEFEAEAPSTERRWSTSLSAGVLAGSSFLIALLSDYVSNSVQAVKTTLGWTDLFLGVVVIATIGNVASLFSAVSMARKNKIDLSFEIGMSAGSQVALLVVPLLVIESKLVGKPISLHFSIAEIAVIFGSVLITTQISQDGECNWLNGMQMLILYGIVAVLFFYLPSS
ncbi:MAG: calcium/proton exchanger [Chroococcidiopsidaceae cyanobacterium CP_BM_ER_R8_30]|nr:calcium/proton exchanger [Chroococcidiopsidaceae cyanobacterium CP_BM_ER_R8_30]